MGDSPCGKSRLNDLYTEAFRAAECAVVKDTARKYEEAYKGYLIVLRLFTEITKEESDLRKRKMIQDKSKEYSQRATKLREHLAQKNSQPSPKRSPTTGSPPSDPGELKHVVEKEGEVQEREEMETVLKQAQTMLNQAVWYDQRRNHERALTFYTDAVEYFLRALKETKDESIKNSLKSRVSQLLSRAEELKGVPTRSMSLLTVQASNSSVRSPSPSKHARSISNSSAISFSSTDKNAGAMSPPDDSRLTPEEIEVLRTTSNINGKTYLPWLEIDLNETFSYPEPFLDPDGFLRLSEEQNNKFGMWQRPTQFMENPKMIHMISSKNILQDVVTDCSFVASLCVSAAYERTFKKQLITRCIYPQNKLGQPCYNPSGKYMIKLIFNGIARKVVVDDFLPVSKGGTLMCTYSTNKNELWPSIIEKAYMKLMGGYDFPGSNPGIDLHALTGWIPEHIFIHDQSFNMDNQWKRLLDGQRYGDALITIATGEMAAEEAEELGLVPTHAYAVLDVREVNGKRLLQVKNPWSHKRWTGAYSHLDKERWTPELREALDYDHAVAQAVDDGIFWIDFESMCDKFDSIHMNWNPELFLHRWTLHSTWPESLGPKKDIYNLGYNPQYTLEINVSDSKPSPMWLLLTKHVTVKEENRDYITLHVYDGTDGERVYYPGKPMIPGVYVNNPHILVRFNVNPGVSRYTVVVSQHEKVRSLHFTLRGYSMSPFTLMEVPQKYPRKKKIPGNWTEQTAGGNTSYPSYMNNPQYRLSILPPSGEFKDHRAGLLLMLEAPRTHAVHVKLLPGGKRVTSVSTRDILAQSGDYRHGFCYCELKDIKPGDYTIVLSTFEPGMVGGFILSIESTLKFTTSVIPLEGAGMFKQIIKGEWIEGVTAMGCPSNGNYHRNPRYYLEVSEVTTVKIRLQTLQLRPLPTTNVTIFEAHPTQVFGREVATSGPYTNVIQGVATDNVLLQPGKYVIVFATWEPGVCGPFQALLYADRRVRAVRALD
ncbi:uncharacterized protein VTP21DRAFT_3148 [Calcarisporiella thermophila]|uniref:uncharacterized protein n=1 Tax=Calcarisporiella thermophila TaxID=911321 RepID=UPI0037443054